MKRESGFSFAMASQPFHKETTGGVRAHVLNHFIVSLFSKHFHSFIEIFFNLIHHLSSFCVQLRKRRRLYWGFSKGWKIWKKTSVHSAAHILTSCQHTEHDALGSLPCMTGSSQLPLFPSLKSYQHYKHNKTKVKIKTFWKLRWKRWHLGTGQVLLLTDDNDNQNIPFMKADEFKADFEP